MDNALTQAASLTLDPLESVPQVPLGTQQTETRGRPAVHILPEDLAALSTGRTTRRDIAELYNCHPCTIRRRLLDFGLSQPGRPVYSDVQNPDGSTSRVYTPGTSSDLSELSDAKLDQVMRSIHDQFPSFGRRMIDGYLVAMGERVPRRRVEASYARVIGPSTSTFGPRRIERRVYSVPAPNSLWHHNGQHGKLSSELVLPIIS